jgi:trk system potassium uptake protein TrkA
MTNYVLLIGGGKVGYYLAGTLKKSGYHVGMVEADADRAAKVAGDLGITVVVGDATEPETLGDADAAEARYAVALTGSDETNLAVCQIAKRHFGVRETIARVINPKNEAVLRKLGVDATISTTAIAAETIEKVLPANGMRVSPIFSQGDVEMAEIEITSDSPVEGKSVAEVGLMEDCLLIAVIRDGAVSFPRGRTVLRAGDTVFALVRRPSEGALRTVLLGAPR